MTMGNRCGKGILGGLLWLVGCNLQPVSDPHPPSSSVKAEGPSRAEAGSIPTSASSASGKAPALGSATSAGADTRPASEPKPSSDVPPVARREPDGNDDAQQTTGAPLPRSGIFERVGKPPAALRHICDLTTLGDALYASHALVPLGADGATITRYRPGEEGRKPPFSIAFDWNRPGQPTKGGGGGQGFLRVRAIGGRLFVPDSDPPYAGFGLVDWGTEGYVFVSSPEGRFAYATGPNLRPPGPPDATSRPGAAVLPRAYHVIDVIRFRGQLMASTGSVPPKERAWMGPSPGALHVASEDLSRFVYAVGYPFPYDNRVWRLTYMVRYRDRLYIGLQDFDGQSPHDYLVLDPPVQATTLAAEYLEAVRVTEGGAAQTLRWFTHAGRLYWIAWERDTVRLRVTEDGQHWTVVPLPPEAGAPSDVLAYNDSVLVLTEGGLYRLVEGGPPELVAPAPLDKHSPFELRDLMCGAPLAIFRDALYAGGQRDGALYRLAAAPSAPPSP
jgi:hypothetical protein